MKQIKSY